MINLVVLEGRLTRDPEIKKLKDGSVVASYTLAVQRRTKDEVDFIPCESWNKLAENLKTYVTKGSLIGIEGNLRVDNYQTEEGKRTFTKVVVNNVHFLDLKKSAGGSGDTDGDDDDDRGPEQFETRGGVKPRSLGGDDRYDI